MMNANIERYHARHDRAHCLAPGIFRSLRKGRRKNQNLDITYVFGDVSLQFVGFQPLGVDDMRFLQGIVALAGPHGLILAPEPTTEAGRQLRLFLDPRLAAAQQDALVVRSSMSHLLKLVGLTDGGDNIKGLKASLKRMANVTVYVTKNRQEASFHLLSYVFDDNELLVAVNPRIAEAILGRIPHTRIEINEVRELKSDVACLIHQWLCAWIDPGEKKRIGLTTIIRYLWEETENAKTMQKRRRCVRKALAEFENIGWKITEQGGEQYEIARPKLPKPDMV
jgi:hypothetical protein